MKDPLQPCKTCNIPHDFHPDIEFYCAESHDLKRQLAHALRERDKARREVCDRCNTDESGCVKSGSEETAISRGWDCYEKKETQ